jgi:undecaprenyl diphosphate synthase
MDHRKTMAMRVPKHIGVIPDGNRRWAEANKMAKEKGYECGIDPGFMLFKLCKESGIRELTYYGFTTDNTKRPIAQRNAFTNACICAVNLLSKESAELLVVGDCESPMFPKELRKYTTRQVFGKGGIKVNFLVNYGWEWDLTSVKFADASQKDVMSHIRSSDVSRIDLIIRWGGRRRLSGFLPVQSVYSDIYVLDDYWPDFSPEQFYKALQWYKHQDRTLGG